MTAIALAPMVPSDQSVALALPPDTDIETWRAIGQAIAAQHRNTGWLVGDWLNFGKAQFGNQAEMFAVELLGEPKSARQLAALCSAFPSDRRNPALSQQHYLAVRDLPAPDRERLLSQAEAERLTPRDLKYRAAARKAEIAPPLIPEADLDYAELMAIVRAWNRASSGPRREFAELMSESDYGIIEA